MHLSLASITSASEPVFKVTAVVWCISFLAAGISEANQKPPFTDYCQKLEQEIQGRKHGFLAGNVCYYVGGFHASWHPMEDETIGLTHPFHHDLRARGAALVDSELVGPENTGRGNDYLSWEFYKDTRVLYGSVIIDGMTYETPAPKSMLWRPDKMICLYEVCGVSIREEKFIGANDAAASFITASQPVILQFNGQSLDTRHTVSSSATARLGDDGKTLLISEGGRIKSRPDPKGPEKIGPSVYTGMTTALSASVDISKTLTLHRDDRGVQKYCYSIPCGPKGVVVSWAMHDDAETATAAAQDIVNNHQSLAAEKTAEMNRLLNDEVPWFRCPDEKFVDIYYFLWAIYLMYSIEVGEGWEQEPHTQTAVNNFLGMHRYDATFQIKVGAWTHNKARFAYGNVLTWKHLTKADRFRELDNGIRLISDNKGTTWHSGAYGGETSEHVLGAWQIYQHTSDKGFLRKAYEDHFKKLFQHKVTSFAMNEFEVLDTLRKIARVLEEPADEQHWKSMAHSDPEEIRRAFRQRWEMNNVPHFFAAPDNGLLTTNAFWCMRSLFFPREYAETMVRSWATNREKGFFGEFFPLAMAKQSMESFASDADRSFGYTPDTAYFTLDGMFKQQLDEAAALAINHIGNYNWHDAWNIPVAPEAYRRDLSLFGDQFSNFNAGKILLYLEGFGGLSYSLPDDELKVRPALPDEWAWMEIRLPIKGIWTTIRYQHHGVEIAGCPLRHSVEGIGLPADSNERDIDDRD